MKLFSIAVFLLLCMGTYAQEKFNNIVYDPLGNNSNTVCQVSDGYVILTGTSLNGIRCYALTKTDPYGSLLWTKRYGHENYYLYEGLDGCLKRDSNANEFYMTGVAIDVTTHERRPFITILDNNLDTLKFTIIDIDSVYGAYDIVKFNDSIYAIITQNTLPDDLEMGLLLFNIDNPSSTQKIGYNVDNTISTEAGAKIIKTHDNKLLLGGFTFGFSTSTYRQDWYLVKTDSIGNMLWERYYGNPSENDGRIMAMLEAQDSTYVLAGGQAICNWSMDPILEACLRKVDTVGNLVWERFYRRYDLDNDANLMRYSSMYISDVIELENGSLVATLNYKRADGDGGAYRFRMVKFSPSGEILFSRTMQNTNIVYTQSLFSSSIKQTTDNGFIINGYGDYMWDYDPTQQFWLIKTDSLGCEGELYTTPPTENVECPGLPDTLYCEGHYPTKLRVQGKTAPYTLEFSTGEIIENLF